MSFRTTLTSYWSFGCWTSWEAGGRPESRQQKSTHNDSDSQEKPFLHLSLPPDRSVLWSFNYMAMEIPVKPSIQASVRPSRFVNGAGPPSPGHIKTATGAGPPSPGPGEAGRGFPVPVLLSLGPGPKRGPPLGEEKLEKLGVLEELRQDGVAFAIDDDKPRVPAQSFIAPDELAAVSIDGDKGIGIAMNVQNHDTRLHQRLQPVDRVVFAKMSPEFGLGHAVGGAGDGETRPARRIADGIDAADALNYRPGARPPNYRASGHRGSEARGMHVTRAGSGKSRRRGIGHRRRGRPDCRRTRRRPPRRSRIPWPEASRKARHGSDRDNHPAPRTWARTIPTASFRRTTRLRYR